MNPTTQRSLAFLTLFLVVGLAITLRVLIVVDQRDFVWTDELHTAWVISGDFSDVLPRSTIGNQSPFFFWIQYLTTRGGRISGVELRMPSLVLGLTALLLAPCICWLLTKNRIAAFAALLVAGFDEQWLFYAVEARPFALVKVLALCQFYLFCKTYFSKKPVPIWRFVSLVISSVLLFYAHYTTVLFLFVQAVVVLAFHFVSLRIQHPSREGNQKSNNIYCLRLALLQLLLSLPLMAPGIKHLTSIGEQQSQWASFATGANLQYQLLPLWIAYLLVPAFLVTLYWLLQNLSRRSEPLLRISPWLWQAAIAVWLPVGIALTLSSIPWNGAPLASIGHLRYLVASIATIPIMTAMVIASFRSTANQFVAVIVLGILIHLNHTMLHDLMFSDRVQPQRQERWGIVASQINTRSRTSKTRMPVFLCPNLVEDRRLLDPDTSDAFRGYVTFALNNRVFFLRAENQKLIGFPTFADSRFDEQAIDLVIQEGGVYLVVRGTRELLSEVAIDLRLAVSERGYQLRGIGQIELPESNVLLVEYVIEEGSAN